MFLCSSLFEKLKNYQMTNNSFLRSQLLSFTLFIAFIAFAHLLLVFKVLPEIYQLTKPWTIYAFLFPVTLIGFILIYQRYLKDETSVVKSYMLFTSVKMVITLIFLSQWLFPKNEITYPFLHQFFVIFFIFLFLEIRILIQMLNNSTSKIEKN